MLCANGALIVLPSFRGITILKQPEHLLDAERRSMDAMGARSLCFIDKECVFVSVRFAFGIPVRVPTSADKWLLLAIFPALPRGFEHKTTRKAT